MPNYPRVETIICPQCECQRSRVRQTTTTEYKHKGLVYVHIRRKRLCDHCGHYFNTIEMLESTEIPGTPKVFVEDLHPLDKSYAAQPKPAPPAHPLDEPTLKDPLLHFAASGRDQRSAKQPTPPPPVGFITPTVIIPPPGVSPSVAASVFPSSPEKPPQAGRRNPYAPPEQ